jgi:hypothetical protein
VLLDCERELAAGRTPDLRGLGFWRAVAAAKRRRELIDRYANRIAAIDRNAFRRRVRLTFPIGVGIALVIGGLVIDVAFLAVARGSSHPWREVLVLVGAAGLDIATHGPAHLLVGALVGIRFTDWFIDLASKRPPGFKTDYASYLRAAPRARAWMHAAGAITTKITPFLVVPYAAVIDTDSWAIGVLVGIGVAQVLSDIIFSTNKSDWKKFRREMRFAG